MKSLSRMPNSYVMTATLLAVIIGSLCFSVGEGLRLRPFPTLSLIENSTSVDDVNSPGQVSLSKYGPLDVPTQTQKRNKRQGVEVASGTSARLRPAFTPIVHSFQLEADQVQPRPLAAPRLGRAPPLNT